MKVLVKPEAHPSWFASGPADMAAAAFGDTIVLYAPSHDDAARWAPALWFALVRGAKVVAS